MYMVVMNRTHVWFQNCTMVHEKGGHEEKCLEQLNMGQVSSDMRFPTMWYVRPAKPQISLPICAV